MDVIAAIATGGAPTAIGIVRVSGPGCFSLCGRVFRAANGRPLEEQEPRRMVLGETRERSCSKRASCAKIGHLPVRRCV